MDRRLPRTETCIPWPFSGYALRLIGKARDPGVSFQTLAGRPWGPFYAVSLLFEFTLIATHADEPDDEPDDEPGDELVPTRTLAYLMGLCLVKLNYECRERHGSLT